MYDELIKRLRSEAVYLPEKFSKNAKLLDVLMKAADAMEELATNYDAATDIMKHQTEYIEELEANKPRWIPVTERLPDKDGRYLVSYPLFNIEAWMRVAYFSTDLHRMDGYAFPGKQYKRPGFYYSDDEYGDVELKDVTHWMPLPEPPKEEGT